MPRRARWSDLWPGLVVFGALCAAVVWVFVYARVGALRGDTYRLYSVTSEARGVLTGTEVWLAGQKVGLVSRIAFRPVTSDTSQRLLLELEILEEYRAFIRRDARAQIRSGGTLIGQPVVYISAGTTTARALEPGDTIVLRPQSDTEGLASEIAVASRVFPDIARNARAIREQLSAAYGSFESIEDRGMVELDVLRDRASMLTREATRGEGTLGRLLGEGRRDLAPRVGRVMARADSLKRLVTTNAGEIARLRRDSTLTREIAALRDEASILRALLREPVGTVGRARTDDAIRRELRRLETELSRLAEDIRRRPLRYHPF